MKNEYNNATKLSIYEMVTRQILRNLASGEIPWRKTWTAPKGKKHPFSNYFSGKPYSFINTLLLGEPGEYATFQQIEKAGGHILKGHHGRMIILWSNFVPQKDKELYERLAREGKDNSHLEVWFLKKFTVFNVEKDAVGVQRKKEEMPAAPMVASEDPTDIADIVVDDYTINQNVTVKTEEGLTPDYDPINDLVTMPQKKAFMYEEDFYAQLMSQLVHSTASEERCNRKNEMKNMSEGEITAREELIAEIGSSMILTVTGMKRRETHEQISAQCQKWIKMMSDDVRLIVNASNGAEKAAKLILGTHAA